MINSKPQDYIESIGSNVTYQTNASKSNDFNSQVSRWPLALARCSTWSYPKNVSWNSPKILFPTFWWYLLKPEITTGFFHLTSKVCRYEEWSELVRLAWSRVISSQSIPLVVENQLETWLLKISEPYIRGIFSIGKCLLCSIFDKINQKEIL